MEPSYRVGITSRCLRLGYATIPHNSFVEDSAFCNTAPMSEMSLAEAQLFGMLGAFFGRERIVWNMSVQTVCGGVYPKIPGETAESIADWAGVSACLFTVVDAEDNPKMVVEFAPDFAEFIEVKQMDRHQRLPQLLQACGIEYVSVTSREFQEIIDPKSSFDFVSLLKDRFGIEEASEVAIESDEVE